MQQFNWHDACLQSKEKAKERIRSQIRVQPKGEPMGHPDIRISNPEWITTYVKTKKFTQAEQYIEEKIRKAQEAHRHRMMKIARKE